jgi:hypothetical protein
MEYSHVFRSGGSLKSLKNIPFLRGKHAFAGHQNFSLKKHIPVGSFPENITSTLLRST